ncbi:Ldh family oxidoreductase [Paenibacillus eucommiae]|uniref:Oxidoreductase n=1 Tax=Paenibacillus eucommiae TaxID=1355755 RepID=A0ABS4JA03_9BACL|nr:Ldh family oxidoreductase [Paenibacillus eucommiae]MBP1996680.1 putative oxidoreductase [Paenibacillus eucommiae]
MILKTSQELYQLTVQVFSACGATPEEAAWVAEELVEASLMGIDSHGVIRIPQYVNQVFSGSIKPGSKIQIIRETPSTAVVDCGLNFGAVSANKMVDILLEKAEHSHIACVVSRRSHHVGRLGAYAQKVAEKQMVALAAVNGAKGEHCVAPWGGREGRLCTNPFAYAVPTSKEPLVFDMSTSMIAEGRLRMYKNKGEPVPLGRILDANGNPSTDPKDFYGPPAGTLLPFGAELGYKGFGLGLLVEILGGVLAGVSLSDDADYVNGLCLIAINPDAFYGKESFVQEMDQLSEYMLSCPTAPGFDKITLPGALDFHRKEQRLQSGVPIDEVTWETIVKAAQKVGCSIC